MTTVTVSDASRSLGEMEKEMSKLYEESAAVTERQKALLAKFLEESRALSNEQMLIVTKQIALEDTMSLILRNGATIAPPTAQA